VSLEPQAEALAEQTHAALVLDRDADLRKIRNIEIGNTGISGTFVSRAGRTSIQFGGVGTHAFVFRSE
jgi:hypothetical protein